MRMIKLAVVASSIAFSTSASASTWNAILTDNREAFYFFDSDTVERSPGVVILWVKVLRINDPTADGSWVGAFRWKLNCSARTIQTLTASTYNFNGEYIGTSNDSSTPSLVVPDSSGEYVWKMACEEDFPRNTSKEILHNSLSCEVDVSPQRQNSCHETGLL